MTRCKPFSLQKSLAAWNLLLAVFSGIGFFRTAPHLLYYLSTKGFYSSICSRAESSFGQGAVGLWTLLFIFSKIPELLDTVFIVLRKKPLIFLHWYHHVTVLLYCWHSYATRSSAGLYFVAMNYGVHAIMYFYYFLTALRIHPPWAGIVTALQISQMFVGIMICIAVFVYHNQHGLPCDITPSNYGAGMFMYGSYFALFLGFALEKYIWAAAKTSKEGAPPSIPRVVKPTGNTVNGCNNVANGGDKVANGSGAPGIVKFFGRFSGGNRVLAPLPSSALPVVANGVSDVQSAHSTASPPVVANGVSINGASDVHSAHPTTTLDAQTNGDHHTSNGTGNGSTLRRRAPPRNGATNGHTAAAVPTRGRK